MLYQLEVVDYVLPGSIGSTLAECSRYRSAQLLGSVKWAVWTAANKRARPAAPRRCLIHTIRPYFKIEDLHRAWRLQCLLRIRLCTFFTIRDYVYVYLVDVAKNASYNVTFRMETYFVGLGLWPDLMVNLGRGDLE